MGKKLQAYWTHDTDAKFKKCIIANQINSL